MTNQQAGAKGGINISGTGGDVVLKAGGDIIAGAKTVSASYTVGFRDAESKEQFRVQIEELRRTLREIREKVATDGTLDPDQKELAEGEIIQQVKALKEVNDSIATIQPGEPPSSKIVDSVDSALKQSTSCIGMIQRLVANSATLAATLAVFGERCRPLIEGARALFAMS